MLILFISLLKKNSTTKLELERGIILNIEAIKKKLAEIDQKIIHCDEGKLNLTCDNDYWDNVNQKRKLEEEKQLLKSELNRLKINSLVHLKSKK